MSFSPDPNAVIPATVATTLAVLRAAAQNPCVKRFVLTSSCAATTSPQVGRYPTITSQSWNNEAIQEAWAEPPYDLARGFAVYAASKTLAEREAWSWMANSPSAFVLNTGQLLHYNIINLDLIYESTSPTKCKLWKKSGCGASRPPIDLRLDQGFVPWEP